MEAIVWEKKIKGWTRKKKEALISRNWDRLKELSICKNGTNSQFFDSAQNDSFDSDAIDSFKSAQNDGKTPDFDDNQNK